MKKNIFFVTITVLLFMACNNSDEEQKQSDSLALIETKAPEILISEFNIKAGDFVGKEVSVSGIVDHVCKHSGKKILLVDGDNKIHVFNDERFSEDIAGQKISVTGIVEEEKIDEAYLTEWSNHEKGSHSSGSEADKSELKKVESKIQQLRDSLKKSGVDHFSNYSLKYKSHKETKK
jgi:hypothetical protein